MSRYFVSLLLLVCPFAAYSQWSFEPDPESHSEPSRNYDLINIKLDLRIDVDQSSFSGTVVNSLRPLFDGVDRLVFDSVELDIEEVSLAGKVLEFSSYDANPRHGIEVILDKAYGPESLLDIHISYSGADPSAGLFFIKPTESQPDKPWQVWTQGEDMDNRHWIPTYDYPNDRTTTEFLFTIREPLQVVSNGHLVGVTQGKGDDKKWRTFHWKMDQPYVTYLIAIGASDWEHYSDTIQLEGRNEPLNLDYYVNQGVGEATAMRSYGETPEMMKFFSEKIGVPYMWDKYAQVTVTDFVVGGMENVSVTLNTDRTLHDERAALDVSSRGLVAHELAHQWWGDYLTCRNWSELWLNEGFATYFESLYERHMDGDDAYRIDMMKNQARAKRSSSNDRPNAMVETFIDPNSRGRSNAVYVKGSSVLYMLHHQLGEELWWKAMNHYIQKHAYGLVDTHDLMMAIREATGKNMDWFFQQWVYLGGYPVFEVTADYNPFSKLLALKVLQKQETQGLVPLFRTPVDIEVQTRSGIQSFVVTVDQAQHEFLLPIAQRPLNVSFDAEKVLLADVSFDKPLEWWTYQLEHDHNVVSRLNALAQVSKNENTSKKLGQAVARVLKNDRSSEVRASAAETLAAIAPKNSEDKISDALSDPSSEVRARAATALAALQVSEGTVNRLTELFENDLSYETQAAALGSLGKLRPTEAQAWAKKAMEMDSHEDVIKAAAIGILAESGDESLIETLLAEVPTLKSRKYGTAVFAVIRGAMNTATPEMKENIIKSLISSSSQGNSRLTYGIIGAFAGVDDIRAKNFLKNIAENHRSTFVRGFAQRTLNSGQSEAHEPSVKDELGTLKKRLEELEQRLEKSHP